MTMLKAGNPMVWMPFEGAPTILRGESLKNGKVLLAAKTFFEMIGHPLPIEFTPAEFILIDQALRLKFQFVRVLRCEAVLYRKETTLQTTHRMYIRHTVKDVEYIVQLPRKS